MSKGCDDLVLLPFLNDSEVCNELLSGIKTPIAILGAEHDSLSPPKLVKEFKQVLDAKPEV